MGGRIQRIVVGVAALACVGGGCMTSPWQAARNDRPALLPPIVTPGKRMANALARREESRREGSRISPAPALAASSKTGGVDPAAMTAVLAELQATGAIDPAAQQQLLDDLQRTDPALWPQMIQVFRGTLAYQRQLKQAKSARQPSPTSLATVSAAAPAGLQSFPSTTPAARPEQRSPATLLDQARPAPNEPSAITTAPRNQSPPAIQTPARAIAVEPLPPVKSDRAPQPVSASSVVAASLSRPATNRATTVQAIDTEETSPASSNRANPRAVERAVHHLETGAAISQTPGQPSDRRQRSSEAPQRLAAPPAAIGWQESLSQAIKTLESQLTGPPRTDEEIRQQATLRMLYLAAGQSDKAARQIEGIPPRQQDFWAKELYGLDVLLDAEGRPQLDQRAAEAALHLSEAQSRLSEMATLVVRNLAFCTEVTSYGVYKPFAENRYSPGQEVLLYAEIDNFKSESSEEGYHTALRSSYQILDRQGHRVTEHEFSVTKDDCRNPRRDFFILYNLFMPKRIYPGNYTLQLTIEDTLSHKIGQSSIEFEIKQ